MAQNSQPQKVKAVTRIIQPMTSKIFIQSSRFHLAKSFPTVLNAGFGAAWQVA
jgi:hypothetical protein